MDENPDESKDENPVTKRKTTKGTRRPDTRSYAQKNPGAKDDSIKKKLKDAVTDHQQLRSKNGNRRQMAVVFMDKNGLVHLFGSKLLRTVLQESSIKQKIVDSPLWLNKEVANSDELNESLKEILPEPALLDKLNKDELRGLLALILSTLIGGKTYSYKRNPKPNYWPPGVDYVYPRTRQSYLHTSYKDFPQLGHVLRHIIRYIYLANGVYSLINDGLEPVVNSDCGGECPVESESVNIPVPNQNCVSIGFCEHCQHCRRPQLLDVQNRSGYDAQYEKSPDDVEGISSRIDALAEEEMPSENEHCRTRSSTSQSEASVLVSPQSKTRTPFSPRQPRASFSPQSETRVQCSPRQPRPPPFFPEFSTSPVLGTPSSPGIPQVINIDSTMVSLAWSIPDYEGDCGLLQGYQVQSRQVGDSDWRSVCPHLIMEPRYTVHGLRPNGEYEFRVLAKNADGLSQPSQSSALVRIRPAAPSQSQNIRRTPEYDSVANALDTPSQPRVTAIGSLLQQQTSLGTSANVNGAPSETSTSAGLNFLRKRLAKIGFMLRKVAGDGNCLFRAADDQLRGRSDEHDRLREEAVQYVIAHREEFEGFLEFSQSFDTFISELSQPGKFGGHIAMEALARLYELEIIVYEGSHPPVHINRGLVGCPQWHLAYDAVGQHYYSVRHRGDLTKAPANVLLPFRQDGTINDSEVGAGAIPDSLLNDKENNENEKRGDENEDCPLGRGRGRGRGGRGLGRGRVGDNETQPNRNFRLRRPKTFSDYVCPNTKRQKVKQIWCSCKKESYGDMVGCDNANCKIDWWHYGCVGLTAKPMGNWYCPNCRGGTSDVMKKSA